MAVGGFGVPAGLAVIAFDAALVPTPFTAVAVNV